MPRILLSANHLVPLILDDLGLASTPPKLVAKYPSLPRAFEITPERMERVKSIDAEAKFEAEIQACLESSRRLIAAPLNPLDDQM